MERRHSGGKRKAEPAGSCAALDRPQLHPAVQAFGPLQLLDDLLDAWIAGG